MLFLGCRQHGCAQKDGCRRLGAMVKRPIKFLIFEIILCPCDRFRFFLKILALHFS